MSEKRKLAIVQTHPVQYYSPLYQLMTARAKIEVKVFYTWFQWQQDKMDKSFGRIVEWDVPILEGYDYKFVENVASKPGLHLRGIINPGLWNEIREWGADAILIYGWNYISHLQLIVKSKGKIPLFFRGDSHLLNPEGFIKRTIKSQFLKWVYKHVNVAFYVGTQNKKYYEAFGLSGDSLIFAPHAVNNSNFRNTNYLGVLREKIAYNSNDFIILFVGKLEEVKDPKTLLKAFLALPKDVNCKLVFVGEGPLKQELELMAEGNDKIFFMGFQNQSYMPSVYALSDVLVLPSVSETWGLAINEAMAAGRAVIVSNKVGCAIDLVKEGINGYIFPAGDVHQLKSCLDRFVYDKKKAALFGQESLRIIQNWSYPEIAEAIEGGLLNKKEQ